MPPIFPIDRRELLTGAALVTGVAAIGTFPTGLKALSCVTISGTPQVGVMLQACGGSGAYQWYKEGAAISGATSSTYTPVVADQGCLLQVSVGGTLSDLGEPVLGTTVRYVSSSSGSDSNPGTFAAPWKTLAHVNAQSFSPGTTVLFKRGDRWQGGVSNGAGVGDGTSGYSLGAQLYITHSGNATSGPIVFDAYGTGANPIIDGSYPMSTTGAWQQVSGYTNVWQSVQTFPPASGYSNGLPDNIGNDVGNLLWAPVVIGGTNVPPALTNHSYGPMVGGPFGSGVGGSGNPNVWYAPGSGAAPLNSLAVQGYWNFNTDNNRAQVYSTSNPASAMTPSLCVAIDTACVYLTSNASYINIQNMTLQKSACCGVMSQGSCNNIVLRDLVIQWIGGGNISGGSGTDSRYGDGIDVEGSTGNNWLVERLWFHQMFDCCFGPQVSSSQNNITMRNCVGTECNEIFETFGLGGNPSSSGTYIYNNTGFDGDGGYSNYPNVQRPNGPPNLCGLWTAVFPTSPFDVNNNIFAGLSSAGILATYWPNTQPYTGQTWLDYNCWPNNTGGGAQIIYLTTGNPTLQSWASGASPAQEAHGVFSDPQFTSQSAYNFSLVSGSPCRLAGKNLYSSGVVWDFNKNLRPSTGLFSMGAFQ